LAVLLARASQAHPPFLGVVPMLRRATPGRACFWVAVALIAAMAPGWAKPSDVAWPEAVARLARERSLAQTCAESLKGHGDAQQISRGQLAYGEAKANFDAVIAGLITALGEGETPIALPELQSDLERGASSLQKFCVMVDDLLPAEAGQRGVIDDMIKAALDPVINALKDGVSALYNNYRGDSALMKATIKTQLEAAKWPDFDQISAAK
jgi:hypothetical protein